MTDDDANQERNVVSSRRRAAFAGVFALLAAVCGPFEVRAQSASPAAAPADYSDPARWLCRPGRVDACAADLDATIVAEDGSTALEPFHADPEAPIDCFYVYPTVSREPTGNADFAIDADLTRAVVQQFARFGARCRLFAPVYRQITVPGLVALLSNKPMPMSRDLAYGDVLAAWRNYLARDNHGRGFVLIGHSQGAAVLTRLIHEEIDGKPIQAQMVSALLLGASGSLEVEPGAATAPRRLPHIPLCHAEADVGCLIAYSSYRAENPPAPGSMFQSAHPGLRTVCVNPAALAGGAGALDAYLSTSGATLFSEAKVPVVWTDPPHPIDTPFVKAPGMLSARCVDDGRVVYLAVTRNAAKDGHRADDIVGDLIGRDGKPMAGWGLHLIDVNLAMGNLIAIVGEETRAYLAKAK